MITNLTRPRSEAPPFYTYPARPINGGPLDKAPPKRGEWAAEPKWNDWRTLVHLPSGTMWNRQGRRSSIAGGFTEALEILRATLDAEAFKWVDVAALERRHNVGRGTLIVLDVIPEPRCAATLHYAPPNYAERRSWLTPVLPTPPTLRHIAEKTVYLTPSTINGIPGISERNLWEACREANRELKTPLYEGIVMKRVDSLYPIQLRNPEETTPTWVKHRWHF